jgi:superfamily II DNA helicase RecQ
LVHDRPVDVGPLRVIIAEDALLAAIVEARPVSPAALRRVKGMGPKRLERYGEEILAIVARH